LACLPVSTQSSPAKLLSALPNQICLAKPFSSPISRHVFFHSFCFAKVGKAIKAMQSAPLSTKKLTQHRARGAIGMGTNWRESAAKANAPISERCN